MKILEKVEPKDLKGTSRDKLEKLLAEETKCLSDAEIRSLFCKLRAKHIEEQKRLVKDEMQKAVELQLKNHEVLTSRYSSEQQRRMAFLKIVQFLETNDLIFHKEFVEVVHSMLEYLFQQKDAVEVENVKHFDFLMKKGVEINSALMDSDARMVGSINYSKYVDAMLELDAKFGLDEISKKHIASAVSAEYGDLVRTDDPRSGKFYYYDATAYRKIYLSMKEKYDTDSKEV